MASRQSPSTAFWPARGLIPIVAALMTACGPAAPASQTQQQTQRPATPVRIVAAVNSIPVALNQMIGAATGSQPGMEAMSAMVNSGLIIVDHRGLAQPILAETVPTVENGGWKVLPDGRMETTWKLRQGSQWHDGTPFSAEDIAFTYRIQDDRELAIFGIGYYRQIDAVETPDNRTVLVRWKAPYIYANLLFGFEGDRSLLPLPRHLLEKPYSEDKATFTNLPYWTTQFVGTGPYKLKEWADGTHAIFQANDRFVLGRPKIDEIEVRFIPDLNTLVSNFLAGALDVNVGRGLELEQARQILERVEGSKTDNATIGAFTLYPQFFMTDPVILLRVEMRRALLHAIDRQEMIDTLAFGQSTIAHTFIHDAEADYKAIEPSVVKYPFDPRRSAQLIEELGFRKGSDGFYRDAENQKLSFEIRTGRGSDRLLSTVADYWQRIGVAADQVVIPPQLDRDVEYRSNFPAFEIVRRGNFRWDLRRVLSSAEAPLPETRYTGGNRGRYMNPDFDAVLFKYDSTIPLEERTNILAQIVRHVSDNAVLMGLFHGLDATVYSKRLHNVHGKFERTTQAWNVHEWEVR